MVKGIDWNLLRQTKDKLAKQQIEDIENAYNDTKIDKQAIFDVNMDNTNKEDIDIENDGDVEILMDVKSSWTENINKSIMKHFHINKQQNNTDSRDIIKLNPKFCAGMIYKFDIENENNSIPTEVMRSQSGYGLVIDDFNEFENDNISNKLCLGYTPINVINAIKESLDNHKNSKQASKKEKIHNKNIQNDATMKNTKHDDEKERKKRTFSEMNDTKQTKSAVVDDDFDIFEDVGRDYVCDPDLPSKHPKRRRVAFMTPTMEKINKLKQSYFQNTDHSLNNSNTKHEAASILKSTLNQAKLENIKIKRHSIGQQMPALQTDNNQNQDKHKGKNELNLRGKLLSSGFSTYDDDEYEAMREYNSDEGDADMKMTNNNASSEWNKIQEKYSDKTKVSKSIRDKLDKA